MKKLNSYLREAAMWPDVAAQGSRDPSVLLLTTSFPSICMYHVIVSFAMEIMLYMFYT